MDTRASIVWVYAIFAVVAVAAMLAYASTKNARTRADAAVAVAKEHTQRAKGRHDLVDFLGLIRKHPEAP